MVHLDDELPYICSCSDIAVPQRDRRWDDHGPWQVPSLMAPTAGHGSSCRTRGSRRPSTDPLLGAQIDALDRRRGRGDSTPGSVPLGSLSGGGDTGARRPIPTTSQP